MELQVTMWYKKTSALVSDQVKTQLCPWQWRRFWNTLLRLFISQRKTSKGQRHYVQTNNLPLSKGGREQTMEASNMRKRSRREEQKHKNIQVHQGLDLQGRLAKSHDCWVWAEIWTFPLQKKASKGWWESSTSGNFPVSPHLCLATRRPFTEMAALGPGCPPTAPGCKSSRAHPNLH